MKPKIVTKLNQLNQDFYQTTAESFNRSRQYFWQGWEKLLPRLRKLESGKGKLKVFDAGCGNARLAEFLHEQNINFEYTGLDNSSDLLRAAEKRLERLKINHNLKHIDLIQRLNTKELVQEFDQRFDLITVFGLLHHIPSFKFRVQLLQQLGKLMDTDSYLVVTVWQFAAEERFLKRRVNPKEVGIKPAQLEKNDYILDWRRGERAFRYCHFVDEEEMERLNQQTPELNLEKTYLADGKSEELNLYLVFKKL